MDEEFFGRTALNKVLCYRASAWNPRIFFPFLGREQQTKNEAVTRKEMLDNAIVGAIGLLAPFIFVMLLSLR
jgi:hypothetical protein